MDTITRKLKGGERTFKIYTKDEADAEGIPYKHWTEAEPGEMALSDDGWVAELWYAKTYATKSGGLRRALKLAYGDYWQVLGSNKTYPIKYEDKRGTGLYSHSKPRSWDERELRSSRGKRLVRAYVAQWMTGELDYKKLGEVYRKDQKIPEATVKRVLKSELFMQAIEDEIEKLMTGKGITKEYVLDIMKEAVEIAKEERDPDILLKAAKEFRVLLGMDPQKKVLTESMEYSNVSQLEDKIEKEKALLTRKTEEK